VSTSQSVHSHISWVLGNTPLGFTEPEEEEEIKIESISYTIGPWTRDPVDHWWLLCREIWEWASSQGKNQHDQPLKRISILFLYHLHLGSDLGMGRKILPTPPTTLTTPFSTTHFALMSIWRVGAAFLHVFGLSWAFGRCQVGGMTWNFWTFGKSPKIHFGPCYVRNCPPVWNDTISHGLAPLLWWPFNLVYYKPSWTLTDLGLTRRMSYFGVTKDWKWKVSLILESPNLLEVVLSRKSGLGLGR